MFDIERQKEKFKNHKATLTDLGNIKILDFKNPDSCAYRIRFLFEEDYCKLHITGDLGELIASNTRNMTYEGFKDYVHSIGYFEEKIDCHSRPLRYYDEQIARNEIKEYFKNKDMIDIILDYKEYDYADTDKSDEEKLDDFINELLVDFSDETGIDWDNLDEKLSEIFDDYVIDYTYDLRDVGEQSTGILDLYMLAFELARKDLEGGADNA